MLRSQTRTGVWLSALRRLRLLGLDRFPPLDHGDGEPDRDGQEDDEATGDEAPMSQDQQRVEDRSQRVDVGATIEAADLAASLFRRHVGRRAQDLPIEGQGGRGRAEATGARRHRPCLALLRVHDLGQAPVHHQNFAVLPDHDVLGLQVPVEDATGVRKGHRVADLEEDGQQCPERVLCHGYRLAGLKALDDLAQRGPAHEFHGVEEPALCVHAELVDRHNPRVLELSRHARLRRAFGLRPSVVR